MLSWRKIKRPSSPALAIRAQARLRRAANSSRVKWSAIRRLLSSRISALSNPLQRLNEFVDLGLGPGVAVVPEIEERVPVARHPIDDLWRHLTHDPRRQAIGHDRGDIRNRHRK